jgi:fatty-acyl-CoA synthase
VVRQSTFLEMLLASGADGAADLDEHVKRRLARGPRRTVLAAPPLMHGTGAASALLALIAGGTVALLDGRRFDAVELWDVVEREQVRSLDVVGDAFARPMLAALDAEPSRWDLGCLRTIQSAGAIFSAPIKRGLLDHIPTMKLIDRLGSSENAGAAFSVSRAGDVDGTAVFRLAPGVRVLDEDGRDVEPGSGQAGIIAIPGGADGYHKDPEKTAATFRVIDGQRYTVAGDYATIEADGTMRLLGRGSVCINSGGEKIFPEEVEEALKTHPAVRDAIVVGVPDEKFGESIVGVVELIDITVTDQDLVDHVKGQLARYKAPRLVVRVDSVGRGPNGKADYAATRALALDRACVSNDT